MSILSTKISNDPGVTKVEVPKTPATVPAKVENNKTDTFVGPSGDKTASFVYKSKGPSLTLFKDIETTSVEKIEKKYNIDIELLDGETISPANLKILDVALSKLQQTRPSDFKNIEKIEFGPNAKRVGAAMSGKTIRIDGAFSEPITEKEYDSYDYSIDAKWLHLESGSKDYIFHCLAHEQGHMVEPQERPAFYKNPWSERFAEDYRIWITSGGESVIRYDLNNKIVPNFQERLEFFQKNYPVNTK